MPKVFYEYSMMKSLNYSRTKKLLAITINKSSVGSDNDKFDIGTQVLKKVKKNMVKYGLKTSDLR